MIKLVVQSGPIEGQVFVPPPNVQVEIGRGAGCFVQVEENDVSRRHAVLVPRGEGYVLLDAGSRNGTFVNGQRARQKPLRSGDSIRVGQTEIVFLDEARDPWVGKLVAGYRIVERLGRGGTGTVYRAKQVAMDRSVALKILSEELSGNGEFVSRFVDEARSMAKVSHPHVVQVHNVGQHGDVYYLSMEYLEGGSLKRLVDRNGPVAPSRAADMILDATRALVWAQQQGIVHRDIKPANLLLDGAGSVKVADFGLAADLSRSSDSGEEGQILGSPHYMAPEQAQGGPVDHRADIYALGGTFYTTLSGKRPYNGSSMKEVLLSKMKGGPTPLSRVAPQVPAALQDVVARCMARDPAERYQSATELYRDLSRARWTLPRDPADATARARGRAAGGGAAPGSRTGARRIGSRALRAALWILAPAIAGLILLAVATGGTLRSAADNPSTPPPSGTFGERTSPAPSEGRRGAESASPTAPDAADAKVLEDAPPGVETRSPASAADPGPELRDAGTRDDPGTRDDGVQGPVPDEAGVSPIVPPSPRTEDPPGESWPRDLQALISGEIESLILESRFEKALSGLEEFAQSHPASASSVASAIRRVRSAEDLFDARARALELEQAGDVAGARELLLSRLEDLEEPYRSEARLAIESLAGEASGEVGGEGP